MKNGQRKELELAGATIGKWTVLYRTTENKYMWHCRCECGTERDVAQNSLARGLSKSCGCANKRAKSKVITKNLAGMQFNRWKVVSQADDYVKPNGKHVAMWNCVCACGNTGIVSGENLKNGHSKSCGCLAKELLSNRRIDNLSGKRFGRLIVQYRVDDYIQPNGNRLPVWHCVCDCGNEVDVRSPNLRYGDTRSCGCLSREAASKRKIIDLVGKKFGRLSVLSRAKDYVSPSGIPTPMWQCKCDCGNIVFVHGNSLRHNRTFSCGCYAKERISESSLIDLSGQVFGKLTVLERATDRVSAKGSISVMWKCICECGKTTVVSASALREGRQTSCGCSHKKPITWINGAMYESVIDLCKSLKVDYPIVSRRIRDGWSLEEAVKAPKNLSLGEYRIREILDELDIVHIDNVSIKKLLVKELGYSESQYHDFLTSYVQNMKDKNINISENRIARFRFDFSLVRNGNLFAFIECDGIQHFRFVYAFFQSLSEFFERCVCDRAKTMLSECNGIPLLRVRYDQLEDRTLRFMINDLLMEPQKYVYRHNTFLSEEEYWKPLDDGNWIVSDQLGHTYSPA